VSYKTVHVWATWGMGAVLLVIGALRIQLSDTPWAWSLAPGLLVLIFGEYLRYRYLRTRT
jgi:ABC-type nickel/cobalt efflux system permease component RcnA